MSSSPTSPGDDDARSNGQVSTDTAAQRTWSEWFAGQYVYWTSPSGTTGAVAVSPSASAAHTQTQTQTEAEAVVEVVTSPTIERISAQTGPSVSTSNTTDANIANATPDVTAVTAVTNTTTAATATPIVDTEIFTSLEQVARHAFIGFFVGSLAAWSDANSPLNKAKTSDLLPRNTALPSLAAPVRYEAIANQIALSGIQFAALGACFSGTIEFAPYLRAKLTDSTHVPSSSAEKDAVIYGIAGATTGLLSALFARPFQPKALVKNTFVLGMASAAYARIAEAIEGTPLLNSSSKKETDSKK